MAIILNFNPVFFWKLKKEMPISIEGRWILTDYKWVHTHRENGMTDGGYVSFSASDSEYYIKFSQGFKCSFYSPANAVFESNEASGGKYSLNVNKNEVVIKSIKQTAKLSVLCLTNDTLQLYWKDDDKNMAIEEFFIFTRDTDFKEESA